MEIRCFDNLEDLCPYAEAWDRLAEGVPFRSWTWLYNWWHHYGSQNSVKPRPRPVIICVFDENNLLVGIAPWYLSHTAISGRTLSLLGTGEVCSDHLSVLVHPAIKKTVIENLAEYLAEELQAPRRGNLHWDLLDLEGVDEADQTVADLADFLSLADCTIHCRHRWNCWQLILPDSWEAYIASLGKNMRREVRRLERNYLDTDRLQLKIISQRDELSAAMEILIDLHQRRQKTLGHRGCFASKRFSDFHRQVLPAMVQQGQAELCLLELDGKTIAAEYLLLGRGVIYAYQAGFDPETLSHQPGKLMNLANIRRAIEQGYYAFDFLRGDEPYKAAFGAKPEPTVSYRIVPHHAGARLRHGAWLAGSNFKRWFKKLSGQETEVRFNNHQIYTSPQTCTSGNDCY